MKEEELYGLLSWKLLEAKCQYYRPELVHESWGDEFVFTDRDYDRMEVKYAELADKLSLSKHILYDVGFPVDSSRGRLVLSLLGVKKPKGHKSIKEKILKEIWL
jgi:hypothetical protein